MKGQKRSNLKLYNKHSNVLLKNSPHYNQLQLPIAAMERKPWRELPKKKNKPIWLTKFPIIHLILINKALLIYSHLTFLHIV